MPVFYMYMFMYMYMYLYLFLYLYLYLYLYLHRYLYLYLYLYLFVFVSLSFPPFLVRSKTFTTRKTLPNAGRYSLVTHVPRLMSHVLWVMSLESCHMSHRRFSRTAFSAGILSTYIYIYIYIYINILYLYPYLYLYLYQYSISISISISISTCLFLRVYVLLYALSGWEQVYTIRMEWLR